MEIVEFYHPIINAFVILDISIPFKHKHAILIILLVTIRVFNVLAHQTPNASHANLITIDHLINFNVPVQHILEKTKIIIAFQIVKILIVLHVIVKTYVLLVLIKQK